MGRGLDKLSTRVYTRGKMSERKSIQMQAPRKVPKVAAVLQDASTAIGATLRHLGQTAVAQPLTPQQTSQIETLLKCVKLVGELEAKLEQSLALQSLSDAEIRALLDAAAQSPAQRSAPIPTDGTKDA